jgi:dihydroxyacetone kinase-like protein
MQELIHTGVMKKLINSPQEVVREALEGMEAAHGDRLRISYEPAYILRKDAPLQGKVALVSGGGSGHEPMHGGYVGKGMLDAACPGQVFTSPTPDQMYEASKAVNGGAGVLHIVKNYTGDIMNFDLAAEMLRGDDIDVQTVLTDDDVAVENSLYTAGRRGVGLTVLMEKLLGAAAEQRMKLAQIQALGDVIRQSGRSMGMALTPCTVPHAGKPSFELPEDEIELGIGIHGEPGRRRVKIASADDITEMLMEPIITDLPFKKGDNVLLFVNGMGGTPLIELYIIYRKAAQIARQHGLTVVRNLVGSYITSLEMAGTSITLLRMNDQLVKLWDAPVDTPALRWS